MEQKLVVLTLLFLLGSCIRHNESDADMSLSQIPLEQLDVKYARGFTIDYSAEFTKIKTRSIQGNTFFQDSIYLRHSEKADLDGKKVVDVERFTVCTQSSTHLSFIDYLNKMNSVKGLCGLRYVEGSALKLKLQGAQTEEICTGDALQTEKLLAINPDLFFIYPFETEQADLEEKGIATFMIAEYLEQHPIARLEWIKVFGIIYGKEKEANEYFERVEDDYFNLVVEPEKSAAFILNLPFGDNWDSPSSNSLLVTLLQDAGLYYHFQDDAGTENTIHSKEEIWEAGGHVPYWVIIANRPEDFSLQDLISEAEVYATFESVQKGNVIFCNSATSGYFTKGIIEPDVMLKDILFARGEISDHNPKYFHILK